MKINLLFICLLFSFSITAQELLHCGSTEAQTKIFLQKPELYKQYLQNESRLKTKDRSEFKSGYKNARSAQGNVYIIPVVFHIIHNYGPENISDAQIMDEVRILNDDFRKRNADTIDIVSAFKAVAGDSEIEFRLANLDPNGNCTNGIDRIATTVNYTDDEDAKLNPWPMEQYLNVWTVGRMAMKGVAGYAYYPGTAPPDKDGVIMLADYIGSIGTGSYTKARVLTHEVGHWLNLAHVWGNGEIGQWCDDDGVADTPETKGWEGCNLGSNDVCNPGTEENVQNYMEYAYCDRMFTIGQGLRMKDALTDPFNVRNQLWTPANLSATGVDIQPAGICSPSADFKADFTSICEGSSVNFYDLSSNGAANTWDWTFAGPATYNSSLQNPSVQFDVPGAYTVSLTATNTTGSDTKTITSYLIVNSNISTYSAPYEEGFESAATTNADWHFISRSGSGWEHSSGVAYSGSASLFLPNSGVETGNVHSAISSSIDLTGLTKPKLYYTTAYAQNYSDNTDILKVYYSINCGRTWVLRNAKSGSILATVPPQTSFFVPVSKSQWRTDSIIIPPLYATSNFKLKFEFTEDGGNNIYLDDINVRSGSVLTAIENNYQRDFNFTVFPNPIEENSVIAFNLIQKGNIGIRLVDLVGRTILEMLPQDYTAGNHSIQLDYRDLNPGVYFVNLSIDKQLFVQKAIVK